MSAFQLNISSWSSQNLSYLFLKLLTTTSGKLFHSVLTLLEKLNLWRSYLLYKLVPDRWKHELRRNNFLHFFLFIVLYCGSALVLSYATQMTHNFTIIKIMQTRMGRKEVGTSVTLTADREVFSTFTVSIQDAWCKLRARRRSISVDICVSPFPTNTTQTIHIQVQFGETHP